MSSLQSRILVAVVGVPLLLYVVLAAPPFAMLVALHLLAGIGAMELQRCVSGVKESGMVGLSVVAAVFTVEWYYDRPAHVAILFLLEALVFFGYAIFRGGEVKFHQIMAGLSSSASPATPSPSLRASLWGSTSWPPRSAPRRRLRVPLGAWRGMWLAASCSCGSWTASSAAPPSGTGPWLCWPSSAAWWPRLAI